MPLTGNNINDDFDDELLSAFVDDELTAAERALVEERLRVDPRARHMVEELRLLSGAIRSLPREALGRDLRASIEAEALQAKADAKADADRNILPISGRDRWANYRRGLVWSAITIAAALMLMMVQPKDVDQGIRDVAKANREEELKELEESRKNRRGRGADGVLPPQGEMRALGAPQEAAKPMVVEGDPATAAPVAPSAKPADILAEASQQDAVSPQRRLEGLESLSKLEAAAEPSAPPPSDAATLGTLAEEGGAQGDALKSMPRGGTGDASPSASRGDLALDKAKDLPADAKASALAQPATIELAMTAPDGVARFEKLLREHAIQFGPEPAAVDAEVKAKQLDTEVADQLGGEIFSRAIGSGIAEADRETKTDADAAAAEGPGSADVLVEASSEQIAALLRACRTDKESFADVSVPESLVRKEAKEAEFEQAGRAGGVAANEALAGEEALTGEKGFAADARAQSASALAPATAARAAGGPRQRGIGGGRAWRLVPPQADDSRMYWEGESPPSKAPAAGKVRVLFRLRPLSPPTGPASAQPPDAKP